MTYAVAGIGHNIQEDCRRLHAIEIGHNLSVLAQALGRILRLGNPADVVYLFEYMMMKTFDDKAAPVVALSHETA